MAFRCHSATATAIVCSFVLFLAILLNQRFSKYDNTIQNLNRTFHGHIESIISPLPSETKVAVSFHDHGSTPRVKPHIVPRIDSDDSDDDDVVEFNLKLEDDDGNPTDTLRLYKDAIFKGTQHRCLMNADLRQAVEMVTRSDKWRNRPLQSIYSNPQEEFQKWGWELSRTGLWEDSLETFTSPEFYKYGLVKLMDSLGLSTDVKHWYVSKVTQSKEWSVDGKKRPALLDFLGRPHYWYQVATNGVSLDSSARTIILPVMHSPSVRRIKKLPEFPPGTLPPDLKSCSDLVYLMYYLSAQSIDPTIGPSGGPEVSIPAPKYFIIPGIETSEVVAVFEHIFQRNELGHVDAPGKKTISVWHTKVTEEDGLAWHMWVEIGDPQPVSVESFPNEHADRGQAVSKGGDLVCMMEMALPKAQEWASRSTKWDGLTVQSRFYDPEEMTKWGWVDSSSKDNLIFLGTTEYFLDGLELEPNNDDEWASSNWDHLNTWTVGSDSGPAIPEAGYMNFFNKDKTHPVLIVHQMYSPSYFVNTKKSPGPAPALSKPSDLWYLQWYQHGLSYLDFPSVASKRRIPAPRHIFIQNIITPEVMQLLDKLLVNNKADIEDEEGQVFDPASEDGKMVLGTRHGSAVCMFLIQHKEQFGDQTVVGIRVWKDFVGWFVDFEIGQGKEDDSTAIELEKRVLYKAKI
ncbi:hypothetical protein EG328_009980 [Venturia inaequalis]|uniref:Uncharacterized protein n=1 Tax=Venturia inaequalis TaxID=5025 RepID=A0A8H3YLM2_VENIN|nr:hypothetical protein EG328_009980 [Venturia inaequalis]